MASSITGILGGLFDPIHIGHLRAAIEVGEALDLDQVRLVPCANPPHREMPTVSAQRRLEMVELAVKDIPGLCADGRELSRSQRSYSVDTLLSLREEFPRAHLCLIVGMDAFCGFPSWHQWERLFELAHIIVLTRPGYMPDYQKALALHVVKRQVGEKTALQTSEAGSVYIHTMTQLDISSTSIRTRIAQGKSVKFLVPDPVLQFIETTSLYHTKSSRDES